MVALLVTGVLVGYSPAKGTTGWYFNKGNRLYDQDSYDEAIEEYNKAIRLDPSYAEVYNDRGSAYYSLGQFERAIEDLSRLFLQCRPHDSRLSLS